MEKHPIEKIAFAKEPSRSAMNYGGSCVNGKYYWHYFTLDGKKFSGDGMEFGPFYDMLEKPGDYFPFCCSYCGVSGCDGIFVPIRCIHNGDEIVLIIREPMAENCSPFCDEYDGCKLTRSDVILCPLYHVKYRAHRVKKAQMREALAELERWTPPPEGAATV